MHVVASTQHTQKIDKCNYKKLNTTPEQATSKSMY